MLAQNSYSRETHDMLASGFRVFNSVLYAEDEREHVAQIYGYIKPPLAATVVDMGCGIGEFGAIFAEIDPSISVIGVTNSQTQLDLMRKLGRRSVAADFHATGIRSDSADVVMFNESIGHGDHAALMLEGARLLKNGGVLFIKDFTPVAAAHVCRFDRWDYTVLPASTLVAYAEQAGLELCSMHRPKAYVDRWNNEFLDSRMKPWDKPGNALVTTAIFAFVKTQGAPSCN